MDVYEKVRPWGWKVRHSEKPDDFGEFFRTKIFRYSVTSPVSGLMGGKLGDAAGSETALHDFLNLLYDDAEQTDTHGDGFRARANVGCLILAEHLEKQFSQSGPAKRFLDKLKSVLDAQASVQIVVAGSIFGGTGASLLPIARRCIESRLNPAASKEKDAILKAKLRFAAIMMMPYFAPMGQSSKAETVDKDRFLLDTSLALQYYGLTHFQDEGNYDRMYLIGSDNPARVSHQLPRFRSGGELQSNPAFIEEWIAAQAIQHFCDRGGAKATENGRVLLYPHAESSVAWDTIPWQNNSPARRVQDEMVLLLHTAAFYLRSTNINRGGLSAGLYQTLKGLKGEHLSYFPWHNALIGKWAADRYTAYGNQLGNGGWDELWKALQDGVAEASMSHLEAVLGEYFVRLLCWAGHAFRSDKIELMAEPNTKEVDYDYARLYSGMCVVEPDAILQSGPTGAYAGDNILARAVRASTAALVIDGRQEYKARIALGETIPLRRTTDSKPVVPLIQRKDVEEKAAKFNLQAVRDAYFQEPSK